MLAVFILGVTCSGKGTFISYLRETAEKRPDKKFAFVEVGKEFRRRYPPEYFKGQGAPAHTEDEAMEIYDDQLQAAIERNPSIIFIDGQPRHVGQIQPVISRIADMDKLFVLLNASPEILQKRAWLAHRDVVDPAPFILRLQRIETDRLALYGVLAELAQRKATVLSYDTSTASLGVLHPSILDAIESYDSYNPPVQS